MAKVKANIYVDEEVMKQVQEMAEVLGWSLTDVWAKCVTLTYPKLSVLVEMDKQRRQERLEQIRAKNAVTA